MTDAATARLVSERPASGEPLPWHFPRFERSVVAGGRVIAAHLPGRPLAVLSLVLDAGAVAEPSDRDGLSLLVARALSEGTSSLDAYAFAVATERLGAGWRADTEWDSLRCGFEVPAGELPAAAALLAEAVREPALTDDTVSRVRDELVDEISVDLSQPGRRASLAFADALFAPESRYSRPDGGSLTSVAAINADDVRAFHRDRFGPDRATLVVVGDLADIDVAGLAEQVFAGWASVPAEPATTVAALRGGGRRVVVVDRPGSVQSMLYVGHEAPPRRTPDYVPMTTMSLALGGMFNSRLNYRLREEKGYTYGAFGGFDCRRDGGVFVARAAVESAVTAPALSEIVSELETMQADGLTAEELERARSYRAGIFPVNFAGAGAVAAGLGELVVHGHADDHFDRLRAAILAVDLDEVNRAAAERLRPADLVAVVVGDAATVAADVDALGIGPLEIVRDEG